MRVASSRLFLSIILGILASLPQGYRLYGQEEWASALHNSGFAMPDEDAYSPGSEELRQLAEKRPVSRGIPLLSRHASVSDLLDAKRKKQKISPRIPVHDIDVNPNQHNPQKVSLLHGFERDDLDDRQRNLFDITEALFQIPRAHHVGIDKSYLPGICYVIYSVAPFEGYLATPVALFKPANLEIGTPSFKKWLTHLAWWRRQSEWSHAGHFPPAAGALRENMCYLMSKKLTSMHRDATSHVPASVIVNIGRWGAGILQEYVISPDEAAGSATELIPSDGIYDSQMQFLLAILTMRSYNGVRFGRVRVLSKGHMYRVKHGLRRNLVAYNETLDTFTDKFFGSVLYSIHNSLTLPNNETFSPLTDLALRRLRLPYGNIPFVDEIKALIERINEHFFEDIFAQFNTDKDVRLNIEIARRALKRCVLERDFTPIQVIRFLYTERPVAFYPLATIRLDRGNPEYFEKLDALLDRFIKKQQIHNSYQCEHVEAQDYSECQSFQSAAKGPQQTAAPGTYIPNDAIVPDNELENVIRRLWGAKEPSSWTLFQRQLQLFIQPLLYEVQKFFYGYYRF